MRINGEVFIAKSQGLSNYLIDRGFKLKRKAEDELRQGRYIYIFNNSQPVRNAASDYFKLINSQRA